MNADSLLSAEKVWTAYFYVATEVENPMPRLSRSSNKGPYIGTMLLSLIIATS